MPWFIIQCERKTWTKYLVEAEDKDSALQDSDNWQYLGYVDGEDTDSTIIGGPFEAHSEALVDIVSYIED